MGGAYNCCSCDNKDFRQKGEFQFDEKENDDDDISQNENNGITSISKSYNSNAKMIDDTSAKLEKFKEFIKNCKSVEILDNHQLKQHISEIVTKTEAKCNEHTKMKKRGSVCSASVIDLPPIRFKNSGQIYAGQWNQEGKKHNFGVLITENGSKYEGYWQNNKFHGIGRLIYFNGDYCEGNWNAGQLDGKGILVKANEEKYKGNFVNNKKQGFGVEVYVDGTMFEGTFNENERVHGKITFLDKSIYKGDVSNSVLTGVGTYKWGNDKSYEGEWINNKFNGKGVFILKNKMKYDGEYKNNIREGNGKFYWNKHTYFEGKFSNGKPNCFGIIRIKSKETTGNWRFGKLIKTISTTGLTETLNLSESNKNISVLKADSELQFEQVEEEQRNENPSIIHDSKMVDKEEIENEI